VRTIFIIIGLALIVIGLLLLVRPQSFAPLIAAVGDKTVSLPASVVIIILGLVTTAFPFTQFYMSSEPSASQTSGSPSGDGGTPGPSIGPTTDVVPTGAPEGSLTIAEPRPNAIVPEDGFPVSGQSSLSVADSLWVVYRGITNSNPSFQPSDAPCSIATNGSFSCPRQYVGGPEDSGNKFELFFLLTGPTAAQVFTDYNASDPAARGYPGLDSLPEDVQQVGTVTVIRA